MELPVGMNGVSAVGEHSESLEPTHQVNEYWTLQMKFSYTCIFIAGIHHWYLIGLYIYNHVLANSVI